MEFLFCRNLLCHFAIFSEITLKSSLVNTGKYDADVTPKVLRVYDSTTRGNMFKLDKDRAKYDLRKFYFTNRVVNAWNSLPDHVVLSETVNIFKSRLDKFWQHQDMIYDFQAELHGTGSRSLHHN